MKAFITLTALCALAGCAYAIDCYSCTSSLDSNCNDKFDATGITNSSGCDFCRKDKVGSSGVFVVTRSCVATCAESSVDVLGISSNTKCCQTDLCNSASLKTISFSAVILPLLAVLAKSFF